MGKKKLVIACYLLITIMLTTVLIVDAKAITRATISIDSTFAGSQFKSRETIRIPFYITKYSEEDSGRYYCRIEDEAGKTVSSTDGRLSDLSVGITKLTLFWEYHREPHAIGKYSVRYYTSNDSGGDTYFYISSDSGSCGSSISWSIDDTKTLTISGKGNMTNYDYGDAPWYHHANVINKIIVEDGVNSIGEMAFYELANIESITLPSTLKTLGEGCFWGCANLEKITIPEGVTKLPSMCLYECTNLTTIELPISLRSIGAGNDETGVRNIKYNGSKTMWKEFDFSTDMGTGYTISFAIEPLKATSLKYVKSPKSSTVKIKWKKISGIDGYEIEYYEKAVGKYVDGTKKIKGAKKTTTTISGLYDIKYVFRIRTYKKIKGGTNYSNWSKTKKVKIKE